MNRVSPAFAAVSRGRFNELAPVLAADIGWRGIAGPDGETPSCRGHETALAVMRRGLAAQGMITVRGFVEQGRLRAWCVTNGAAASRFRFVVAEVNGRELTRPRAFASESEARAAMMVASRQEREVGVLLLAATGIAKSFGRKRVLDDAALEARGGEVVAVVGENGAGKSTLLRICAGLEQPDGGTVTARGRVGYCPQQPGLFDLLTADEHLRLFAPALGLEREEGVREGRRLLSELGFPVGDRAQARRLSGGARQKLNLALALLGDARVLLLDEPYQGFDHGAYVSFWEHVSRWRAEGLAIVIVTHLLADTTLVDRVVELTIRSGDEAGGEER